MRASRPILRISDFEFRIYPTLPRVEKLNRPQPLVVNSSGSLISALRLDMAGVLAQIRGSHESAGFAHL